jgi:hypothetical protein
MKLPKFKKQADIPEALREFYHEVEGEWVVDPAKAEIDDASELKESLRKEREAKKTAEAEAKRLKKEAEDKARDDEHKQAGVSDAQLKKIRLEVREELEKEYTPTKTNLEKAQADLRTLRLDNAVKGMFGHKDVRVRGERHDTLWKLIADRFDLTDDNKPFLKDKPGTPIEKYLADAVKKEYPEFFEGTKAEGGGAGGAGGTGTTAPPGGTPGAVPDVLANPGAALQAARSAGKTE